MMSLHGNKNPNYGCVQSGLTFGATSQGETSTWAVPCNRLGPQRNKSGERIQPVSVGQCGQCERAWVIEGQCELVWVNVGQCGPV